MNRGQSVFAQRSGFPAPAADPRRRAPSSPMLGPERANMVNSNFTQRRSAGGYGGYGGSGGGAKRPPPEIARLLNTIKTKAAPMPSQSSGSFKDFQRKYVPGSYLAAEEPPAPQPSRFPVKQQPQRPNVPSGLPSESRRYVPQAQQQQAPPQAPPPQPQAPQGRSGGRRPAVDLSAFQRPYSKKPAAAPPKQAVAPPQLDDLSVPHYEDPETLIVDVDAVYEEEAAGDVY